MLKYFNSFIVIGVILFVLSIAGFATNSVLISEPGQPINHYASLEYLAGAIIMLANGFLTLKSYDDKPVTQQPSQKKTSKK